MVEFKLHIVAGVPAIRIIRCALGLGLKEAKDLHDVIRDAGGSKAMRGTFAQYGALDAYSLEDDRLVVWLGDVKVVQSDVIDLTRM